MSLPGESSGVGSRRGFPRAGSIPSGAGRERLLLPHLAGGGSMTDLGNIQAGAVGTAPVAARLTIQVVRLKGLPIVAVVVAFVIASIAGNWVDHVRGAPLAVVFVMLVIFALDVPLIIAFTVARYASPAGYAGSIPDVSRPA